MYLTILDLVLILIVFIFITFGFITGLIQTIGALVGIVAGTWIAGLYFEPVGQWHRTVDIDTPKMVIKSELRFGA